MTALERPSLFEIALPDGGTATGGDQLWYPDLWAQKAGCGPVAACNMVWYLSRIRPELSALCDPGDADRAAFVALMERMFTFITPGKGGIHSSALFAPGLEAYCAERGLPLRTACLEIPRKPRCAPTLDEARAFLSRWLGAGWPVAFLNLSNGRLRRPDSWHWVTILAFEPDTLRVRISDGGKVYEANLGTWLQSSLLGGALVALHGEEAP